MTKGSILQGYVTILNVHVPNNTASKYTRQTLVELQEKTGESTTGDFSTCLSEKD